MAKQPFIPAPNCVQLEAVYESIGQKCENVYHVHLTAPPTIQKLQDLANEVIGWEVGTAKGLRNNNTGLLRVIARDMSAQNAPAIETAPANEPVGTAAGSPMPNNVTIAVKHVTGLSGRSFRGRSYWIGLSSSMTGLNQISQAANTAIKSAMGTLMANLLANAGGTMVVLSRRHDNAWRTTAVATPVVTFNVDPNLDSQRRRLAGRGS